MSSPASKASPRAVFTGSVGGDWQLSLINPKAIREKVGRDILAAILKCFVGTDRVMTLEQMLDLNARHIATDSPAHDRNLHVLVFLMAGTLYELAAALQELCNAKVVEKMADTQPWTAVNDARKQWHNDPLMAKFRNQLAHHLGDVEAYGRGIDAMFDGDADLLLAKGYEARHSEWYPAAWDALFRGVDIDDEGFQEGIRRTKKTHDALPDQLIAVFREVLKSCGIEAEDRRSKP
jgi:hypothetical protein